MIPHVLSFKRDVHDSNSLYISYDNQFILEFGALEDKSITIECLVGLTISSPKGKIQNILNNSGWAIDFFIYHL